MSFILKWRLSGMEKLQAIVTSCMSATEADNIACFRRLAMKLFGLGQFLFRANTKDMFLVYCGNSRAELRVDYFCDAGFETDRDDIKSQTGYVFILNGGAVD
ncbi:hypothetical protein Tco_0010137 [Tanacetum coccineum]